MDKIRKILEIANNIDNEDLEEYEKLIDSQGEYYSQDLFYFSNVAMQLSLINHGIYKHLIAICNLLHKIDLMGNDIKFDLDIKKSLEELRNKKMKDNKTWYDLEICKDEKFSNYCHHILENIDKFENSDIFELKGKLNYIILYQDNSDNIKTIARKHRSILNELKKFKKEIFEMKVLLLEQETIKNFENIGATINEESK